MANLSREQFMAQALEINKVEIQNKFDELLPQIQKNLQNAANYFITHQRTSFNFPDIFKNDQNLIDYVVEQLKESGWDAATTTCEGLGEYLHTASYKTIKINK
jgi:hypothetical protein